ncbi:MAG: hypothetical protein ACKVOW_02185 [Chitinophagaceae bacterium]
MKRTFIITFLALVTLFTVASCSTSKGGCRATQGFLGYGHR